MNQIVDSTWNAGLDPYNLYAECAGGATRNQMVNALYNQVYCYAFDRPPFLEVFAILKKLKFQPRFVMLTVDQLAEIKVILARKK